MRKLVVVGLSICLTLGLAGFSLAAKKNERLPLAVEVVPVSCVYEQPYNFTGSDNLEAVWTAVEGDQTKFGGDAKFKVMMLKKVDIEGYLDPQPVEVELMFDPDLAGMDGYFLYNCTMGNYGTCTATLPDVQLAIKKAVEGTDYGSELYDYSEASATFLGVWVKGMNPSVEGFGTKKQNYPLVEVCNLFAP